MKYLIIVRHGETENDKTNPNRGLTENGIRKVRDVRRQLKKWINSDTLFLCTNTKRAKETAEILSGKKGVNFKVEKLRPTGASNIKKVIEENRKRGISPAETYLYGIDHGKYWIESPEEITMRFLGILKEYLDYKTIVIVGHEGSLDAFYRNQKRYKILDCTVDEYFGYGDYVVYGK